MDNAAIGIAVHSGWGVVVAVAKAGTGLKVLDRARLEIIGTEIPGWKQPYHHAQKLSLAEAARHIATCATASSELALKGMREVAQRIHSQNASLTGSAVLLGSGKNLPDLSSILKAHPLIHTAEGEFFRRIFWEACCRLEIPIAGFRARELENCAFTILDKATKTRLERNVRGLRKSMGPPWTLDHHNAALAAALMLLGEQAKVRSCSHEPAQLTSSQFA